MTKRGTGYLSLKAGIAAISRVGQEIESVLARVSWRRAAAKEGGMCGIVGILGDRPVAGRLLDSLRHLEYRGYDSAGIATLEEGRLARRRAAGRLPNLEAKLTKNPLAGKIGIGHTRWATHGKPTEANAHPLATEKVAVVHNGIIENFRELRQELAAQGRVFESQTDTEVIAHLVTTEMYRTGDPANAVSSALSRLKGAFALAFLFDGFTDLLIGARRGAPLAVGYGRGEMYLGSDAVALSAFTETVAHLEEGDWVVLSRVSAQFRSSDGAAIQRRKMTIATDAGLMEKGNYRHFMAKEIHEQPEVVTRTLSHYVDMVNAVVRIPTELPVDFAKLDRIHITACGTAHLAGQIARHWFERFARLPVDIDIASEFRYREVPMKRGELALLISQSGETADTLAALRYVKEQGAKVISIVNVSGSTMARESDLALPILAGPEIGVASTKAFTCQLAALACLAIAAGRRRGYLETMDEQKLVRELIGVPGMIAEMLQRERDVESMAAKLAKARSVLYLGRGMNFPLAQEGALKLKELSYIHAEGFAAGELKHGPLALVDEDTPVVILVPRDGLFDKTVSNVQEAAARRGRIFLIGPENTAETAAIRAAGCISTPDMAPDFAPMVYAVAVQLLAYYAAAIMGKDVDQPRNLAKSVTVE